MATPPSPKRARQGASPFDIDDSLIDPALAATIETKEPSPPPAPEEKQEQAKPNKPDSSNDDPTYQLALERAYADQRFKATMNHIFDKYGRDFDGIGDEIDLETGEIVVNNGHIRNMRNEADVGDGSAEPLEEDEGMYLGDLTDESEDEHQEKDSNGQNNEDTTVDEPDSQQQSTTESVPPQPASQAPSAHPALDLGMNMYDPRFMAMLPALYAGVSATFGWGMPPGMEAQSQPQQPPPPLPQAFAPPPMPWAPWGMPTDYPMPPWMQPFPSMPQAPAALQFNTPVQRYNFPPQSGRSSVWARNPRYRDDVGARPAGPSKRPSALSARNRIEHSAASNSIPKKSVTRTDTDSYDGDEANAEHLFPLQGRRPPRAFQAASDPDDDSDYIWEQEKPRPEPAKIPRKRGRPKGSRSKHNLAKDLETNPPVITSKIEIKKRQREELKDKLLAKYYEENPEADPQPPEEEEGRRRSGRDRKRVASTEEMVSWDRVKAERRAEYKAMMSIRSDRRAAKASNGNAPDTSASTSFESAVSAASDRSPTPEPTAKAVVPTRGGPPAPEPSIIKSSIPDSQEISLSQSVTGSQQVDSLKNKGQESLDNGYEALCAFSDDEAPAIIQMRKPKIVQPQPSENQDPASPTSDEVREPGAISNGQASDNAALLGSLGLPRENIKEKIDYTELFETDHDYTELLDIFPSSSPSPEPSTLDDVPNHVPRASTPTEDDSFYVNEAERGQPREGDDAKKVLEKNVNHEQESSIFINDDDPHAANESTAPATLAHGSILGSLAEKEAPTVEQRSQFDSTSKKSSPGAVPPRSGQDTPKADTRDQDNLLLAASKSATAERLMAPAHAADEIERLRDDSCNSHGDQPSNSARQNSKEPTAITSPITTKSLVILSPKPSNPTSRPEQGSAKRPDSAKAPRSSSSSKRKPSRSSSSKRHSLLSLFGDEDDAEDVGRNNGSLPKRRKSSDHSTPKERQRKPRPLSHNESSVSRVKKRARETESTNRKVKSSAGPREPTASGTCGVDGFICGRDFCFTCL